MRQAGEGKGVSTKRLGKWLSKISGRIFDGLQLDVRTDASNGNRYHLRTVNTSTKGEEEELVDAAQILIPRSTPVDYRRASRGE